MTKKIAIFPLVCLVSFALYLWSGTTAGEPRFEYRVDAHSAASGVLHVTVVIQPPVRPFVTLWLRDAQQGGRPRVEGFSASRDGRALPSWQPLPGTGDARNVWTGFRRAPITVRYDVNPRWVKGQSPKAFLGPDFGYFKGEVFLYTPIAPRGIPGMLNLGGSPDAGAGQAELEFLLPDGWTLVSPRGHGRLEMPIPEMRGTYFGIGPMSLNTAQVGESTLLLGVYAGLGQAEKDRFLRDIPVLFETMGKTTGLAPDSETPYWALTILPSEPIGGGSSGTNSLVTSNKLPTISHEIFHWWNGDTINTTPDADWIHEGFTTYYEGKMLYAAGIWSLDEFNQYLDGLYEDLERTPGGTPAPLNLVQASEDLMQGANEEYYNVYHGGALVAFFLDRELQAQGKSLDEIWGLLDRIEGPITTQIFLQELETLGGAELAKTCEDLVYGRRAIP